VRFSGFRRYLRPNAPNQYKRENVDLANTMSLEPHLIQLHL
jgi:hypothetical protein